MATYDENLNIIEDVNVDNFPQYQNIKYNIGSIIKNTGELKDYFAKIFDKSTHISGSITYGLTPDNILVEHYNPKTKNVTFEQVNCFHFNNVVIRMLPTADNKNSYLKYYKLQKYKDIIESNPNASHNLNANNNSYRFVYTCQKVEWKILEDKTIICELVLNGYYGVNGWELLVRNLNFNPLDCYKFQKDGESKKLFNPEYYQLTKKTRKLEKLGETVVNLQTGNSLQQVKFPGFYTNNKSFIRFANQLTNDTTQYKLADNKDSHHNNVLPINSDNLGYEDLKNSKIILFNGFDNNYELINIAKTDNDIAITYKDWTKNNSQVTSTFQLRPKDKIYIVKRESSTVNYDNNKIYTSATYGPYNRNSAENTNFNIQPRDFIYTLSIYYSPRLCLTGPTTYFSSNNVTCNTLYLKFNNPGLTGTYISNSTDALKKLNFSALTSYYQKFFVQTSYNQKMIIDSSASYGNTIDEYNNIKLKNLEFISKNKKVSVYDMNDRRHLYEFMVNNIKIDITGSTWTLQNGTQPKFNNFTTNSSKIINIADCLSIVSTIDNKPGMLPNYINLLSKVETASIVEGWLVPTTHYGTLETNKVSISSNILEPLNNTVNDVHYDLRYDNYLEDTKPLFLRFGFESKTYTPSVGYIIFLELGKAN